MDIEKLIKMGFSVSYDNDLIDTRTLYGQREVATLGVIAEYHTGSVALEISYKATLGELEMLKSIIEEKIYNTKGNNKQLIKGGD